MDSKDAGTWSGPSRVWYGVGAALIALSMVVAVFIAVAAVRSTIDRVRAFQRVAIPGTEDVQLNRAGPYTIYYEGPGIEETEGDVTAPRLAVTLQRLDDGSAVPVRQYRGQFTYDVEGHNGVAVSTFRSPAPGNYRIESRADLTPGQAELAVGRSITAGILKQALAGGMACFLAFIGGVVVLVVTAVRRHRVRRPAAVSAPYPPYPPPPLPPAERS